MAARVFGTEKVEKQSYCASRDACARQFRALETFHVLVELFRFQLTDIFVGRSVRVTSGHLQPSAMIVSPTMNGTGSIKTRKALRAGPELIC
jgi:hypothetical protein